MTRLDRYAAIKHRAAELFGGPPVSLENPLTVLASPAWRGIEGDIWTASTGSKSVIFKHYHPDTEFYVDAGAAIEAAKLASAAGVGPVVMGDWSDDGIIAFENLDKPWRSGGLQDVVNPSVRSNVIGAKKAFHQLESLASSACIFEELDWLMGISKEYDVPTHRDVEVFHSFFTDAKSKIRSLGQDQVPCHRDGNTANYMVGEGDQVRLIDFDLSANADPFEDLGCHLVEFYESETDARPGFEEWQGSFDEGLFQRAMIFGLADDMRWGLIGAIMAANSPRTSLEFSKYSAWRFIRLEARLQGSDANDRIRAAV
jgi:thiamine kinase-like enzyme